MKAPANCRLIGRWRIVEADLWDRDYPDLCGPATLIVTAQGGEIAFGALEAGLQVEFARDSIGFRWAGCDEGDESKAKGPPNSSTTARSRSNSPSTTATKPSSKQSETLLQQPDSDVGALRRPRPFEFPQCAGQRGRSAAAFGKSALKRSPGEGLWGDGHDPSDTHGQHGRLISVANVAYSCGSDDGRGRCLARKAGSPTFARPILKERAMATGTVRWLNATKGFGFIQPGGGGPDVFANIGAVERAGMRDLNEGQKIAYEIVADWRSGKSSADNLRPA